MLSFLMSEISPKIAAARVMSRNVMEGGAVIHDEDGGFVHELYDVIGFDCGGCA